MKREDKIALIDGDSLIYYEMKKNTLEEALAGIDMRINQMLNITGCKHYAGFLTKGKCFRYNVATTRPYKYNRKRDDLPRRARDQQNSNRKEDVPRRMRRQS